MRRFTVIFSLLLAIGLLIAGGSLLLKATRLESWSAAMPALSGLACLIVAGALIGRQALGVIAYPVAAFFGHLFHPETRFTETPKSQLLTLRARIAEGRFKSTDHQVRGLLKAYPKDAGLYHVWALLEAARGRQISAVTAEASSELPADGFAEYEALLRAIPPHPAGTPVLRPRSRSYPGDPEALND